MYNHLGSITSFERLETEFYIKYDSGEKAKLNILDNHIFKYYMSPSGHFRDYPKPHNLEDTAKITVKNVADYDKEPFKNSILKESKHYYYVLTNKISIRFHKKYSTMNVKNKATDNEVLIESKPLKYDNSSAIQTLQQREDEHYFGGGMQTGTYCHKKEKVSIVSTNKLVHNDVASPCPFYWSTKGYGILRNTWQKGLYDFGSKNAYIVETSHQERDFDAFFFFNSDPSDMLKDYYELTGHPIMMPEFAFYQAHLHTFNRDHWVQVPKYIEKATLFEDGLYYLCYRPEDIKDEKGIRASLNGDKDDYQFSARAMIDRYQIHDMPLGWFIPNDGSGYGQTNSLQGDILNLKQFTEYAKTKGVATGIWTDPANPKSDNRDLIREVAAGIAALKFDTTRTQVGYSFGLTAVQNATRMFIKASKDKTRPMVLTVDAWAGIQRHAAIWTGNQFGGKWNKIRTEIPMYIGAGLSGIPVVGSDIGGIYRGGDTQVNIRDYQWKSFTPLQLNMNGNAPVPKTPFTYDKETTLIIKDYLKLKSKLMPYNYTIGRDAIKGLPMIRAMFLEFPNENYGYTKDAQYQYMWGNHLLIAPVYRLQYNTKDEWVRHGIYLPDPNQVWIDLLTGEKYQGGKIWNFIKAPLWKLPVFVKDGAILPMVNSNNNPNEIKRDKRIFNIYPNGESHFNVYEDDGMSLEYLGGNCAVTQVTVMGPNSNESGDLDIHIHKTKGTYTDMFKERATFIRIMGAERIPQIKATINNVHIELTWVFDEEKIVTDNSSLKIENAYCYNIGNPYLDYCPFIARQKYLLINIKKNDVTVNDIHIYIKNYQSKGKTFGSKTDVNTNLPVPAQFKAHLIKSKEICVRWSADNKYYYEIERDDSLFTNITGSEFTFEGFEPASEHCFRIRSADDRGVSNWSDFIKITTKSG